MDYSEKENLNSHSHELYIYINKLNFIRGKSKKKIQIPNLINLSITLF